MILVTGAAGKTGKAVVSALAAAGAPVRAMVRRPEQVAALQALGAAEVVTGSFEDADSLRRAATGALAIYHICPNVSSSELTYAQSVAAAARGCGVRRFVYHSVLHPQIEAMPHHWRKMRVEEMLMSADFAVTILQPTAYMQNILGAWRSIAADGVLPIPYPAETRISLVDLDDVGAAAALVLTQEGHDGATYELVGTAPLSQREVAAAIGGALGKSIRIEEQSVHAWEASAEATGMEANARATLAAMFRYYASHGLRGNPNTLRWLLGRAPNDLPGFLKRHAVRAA
jgi:NAD(P)H dehydrogenase (quinone)